MDTYEKIDNKYICVHCKFSSPNRKDYRRHIETKKHLNTMKYYEVKKRDKIKNLDNIDEKNDIYCNNVNKEILDELIKVDEENISKESYVKIMNKFVEVTEKNNKLIDVVVKQQEKINDIIPKIGNTTNNQVNINLFLNENCKDAINLMDFVSSLQLKLSDLENSGKIGYVDTISKIMIDGLSQMKLTDRPIHCYDPNRDILYVKDNDVWEKDCGSNDKMKKAIEHINKSNAKQIPKWIENHPDSQQAMNKEHDTYMNILSNTIACDEEDKNVKRIIKKIAKAVVLDKDDVTADD